MQTHSSVSTRTIVLCVMAACIVLIIALLIFRARAEVTQPVSVSDVMLFPAGRDIKPFELVSTENKPFTQKNFDRQWTLLFFGYTHCADVCPMTLEMLSRAYHDLHPRYPNLQVVLVSLDPERDTQAALSQYVKRFDPAFIGVSGPTQSLRKLQSQLGIYAMQGAAGGGQIQHTPSIMLVDPQGKWAGMFKYGLSPSQFIEKFDKSIRSLSGGHDA